MPSQVSYLLPRGTCLHFVAHRVPLPLFSFFMLVGFHRFFAISRCRAFRSSTLRKKKCTARWRMCLGVSGMPFFCFLCSSGGWWWLFLKSVFGAVACAVGWWACCGGRVVVGCLRFSQVARNGLKLMQDPFGNYVVQYVLKTCSRLVLGVHPDPTLSWHVMPGHDRAWHVMTGPALSCLVFFLR